MWRQVVYQDLPQVSNPTNTKTSHPSHCSHHRWIIPQSTYWHYGNALLQWGLFHCSGFMYSYCISQMVHASLQECDCDHIVHFWRHPLLLGSHLQASHWQWNSIYIGTQHSCKQIWHYNIWEAIIKSTLGGEVCWPSTTHFVFWAECVMILKTAGLSLYFMVHGIKLLFPFDLVEVTFLVPTPLSNPVSTNTLIVWQAHQLQKQLEDIDCIQESICASWFVSHKEFENCFKNQIHNYNFGTSNLVLVQNLQIKKELNQKMKPCYLSSMVVLCRTTGGSYLLVELDGAISRL